MSIDGRPVVKPSTRVDAASVLTVDGEDRFVSRAALKLDAALDLFPIPVSGRLALDLGASTGGFTQVLLERGAREVIALDVGHGQLAPVIRNDPRVRVVEGVNARDLDATRLAEVAGTAEVPELVVADLSFISLRHIVPPLAAIAPAADIVLLVEAAVRGGSPGRARGNRAGSRPSTRRRGRRRLGGVGCRAVDARRRALPVLGTHGNQRVPALAPCRCRSRSVTMGEVDSRARVNRAVAESHCRPIPLSEPPAEPAAPPADRPR